MERIHKNTASPEGQRLKMELVAAHEHGQTGLVGQAIRQAAQDETLADFVAGLYATDLTEQEAALPVTAEIEALSLRARQRALTAVFSASLVVQVTPVAQAASAQPISLSQARSTSGLTLVQLARRLDLGADVVQQLERGRIVAASVPQQLVARLAEVLTLTGEQIWTCLRMPPTLHTQPLLQRRRTTGRLEPSASLGTDPQPFAEAVAHSPSMTAEQRAAWLQEPGNQEHSAQ